VALEFVRWNSNASSEMEFSPGDCVGIQVARVSCKRGEILRAEGNCIGSYTKSIRRDLYNGQDSLLIIHNPIQLIKLPIVFIYILPYRLK